MEGLDQFLSIAPQFVGFCVLAWVLIRNDDKNRATQQEQQEWERAQRKAEQEENRAYMSDLVAKMERLAAYFAASQPTEVIQKVTDIFGEGAQ